MPVSLKACEDKGLESVSSFPSVLRGQVVCVHPSTLCHHGLSLGKWLLVTSPSARCMGLAWPRAELKVDEVALSAHMAASLSIEFGAVLSVCASPSRPATALQVALDPVQCDVPLTEQVLSLVKRNSEGACVCVGAMLSLRVFNSALVFRVSVLVGGDCVEESSCQQSFADESALEQNVAKLDLNAEPSVSSPPRGSSSPGPGLCRFYRISSTTRMELGRGHGEGDTRSREVRFEDLGGLDSVISEVRQVMRFATEEQFRECVHRGFLVPRCVLVCGPSGTGKTMLLRAIAREDEAVYESASSLVQRAGEQVEEAIDALVRSAKTVLVLDDVDHLVTRRTGHDSERRGTTLLVHLLDAVHSSARPLVLFCATSRVESLDACVRRPGRFDKEVELSAPNACERAQILECLLRGVPHSVSREEVVSLADGLHGFVGADMRLLLQEACVACLSSSHDPATATLSCSDLLRASPRVKPSVLRELSVEVPRVCWHEIGGLLGVKQQLRQMVEWPLRHPDAFRRLGLRPPKGVLLYGPPGCSKTTMARALATESGLNFVAVKGPELLSKWVGESERAVREVFRKARAAAPCIIFFDEMDALAPERGHADVSDRVLAQMLTEMDGVTPLEKVVVVAATNRPDLIDMALLRPGRIDRLLYVPLPDTDTRRDIVRLRVASMPLQHDVDLEDIVARTEGFSGAEMILVCNEAAMAALQDDIDASTVCRQHFAHALLKVRPRTTAAQLDQYSRYEHVAL